MKLSVAPHSNPRMRGTTKEQNIQLCLDVQGGIVAEAEFSAESAGLNLALAWATAIMPATTSAELMVQEFASAQDSQFSAIAGVLPGRGPAPQPWPPPKA